MPKLSTRLEHILSMIPEGKSLWDICCDHGELAVEAGKRKITSDIHCVDQVKGIIKKLDQKIKDSDIPGVNFKTYCEDATKIPRSFSNSIIVIAGVGETTAISIIKNYKVDDDCQFVLSIHSDNYELRKWLTDNAFKLYEERIIKDKAKFYEIMKIGRKGPKPLSLVGTEMWDKTNPVSLEYLETKISYLETALRYQNNDNYKDYLNRLRSRRVSSS